MTGKTHKKYISRSYRFSLPYFLLYRAKDRSRLPNKTSINMRITSIRVPGLYHTSVTMVLDNRHSCTTKVKLQYQLSYTENGAEYRNRYYYWL